MGDRTSMAHRGGRGIGPFGAAVVVFVVLALGAATILIEDKISDGPSAKEWVFWLQTASGNWSPTVPKPDFISKRWFAISAVIALVVNNSLYLAIVAVVWQIAADRRRRMTLREALDVFEVAARAELIKRLASPDSDIAATSDKIDQGLAEGRKAALPIIAAVWGQDVVATWEKAQDREFS